MKIKLIYAAVAAGIAVSAGIVAVAYGNSAQDKGDATDISIEQQAVSAEDNEVSEDGIRDAADADTPAEEKTSDPATDVKFAENENDTPDISSEQSVVSVEDKEEIKSVPAEDTASVAEAENSTVKAVNSINRGITYIGKFSDDGIPGRAPSDDDFGYRVEEDSDISLGYLKEFFGNENLPVDDKYKDSLLCYMHSGVLEFDTVPGAVAKSPVGGKVIGVCVNKYNGGLGNTVAVEFDGKIFVMAHLDSVSVKTGDEITAGQTLGVCGNSGMVMYDKTQLGMILMEKQ